jgi:signal transduction histidine kinase
VISASEQGAALTRQLLNFSHDVPVIPRPVQLNRLITEGEGVLHAVLGRNIELVCNPCTSPGTVLADDGQMHQVLLNLALNARDAMPQGGKLTITLQAVEVREAPPPGMPEVPPGAYVQLDVADTGSGMPEDVRTHVFEPFFTTKRERGTGLGLASVYGIVRQSGGYISVDSAPGKGSAFHILLPALAGAGDKGPE